MSKLTENRGVKQELAQLGGDPNDVEFNFPAGDEQKLTPYTRPKDSNDPEDQYSELVSFRCDGALKRLGEETVELLRPYYRTHSDMARDAYFKWIKYLQETFLAPGSQVEPVAIKLDMLSKRAYETDQRRRFVELINQLDRNLADLIRDGAVEKLAEETADYCDHIKEVSDGYWRNRSIREFCEMPSFATVLRTLRGDERYKESGLVKLLETWNSQRYVIKE